MSLNETCVCIRDFEELEEEISRLRKRVKKLQKITKDDKSATHEVQFNGLTEVQLREKL